MKLLKTAGLLFALLLICVPNSFGIPITFTHEGSGSGTIAGNPFGASNFVITATGDTSSRQVQGSAFFIDHLSASINISGVGVFSFTTGTRTFVNNGNSTVGFSRAGSGGADLFNGPTNAAFSAYDLLSSIGPIAGNGSLLQWTNTPVNTSGGVLVFTSASSPATFTARTAAPEPTSLVLLGLGLIGTIVAYRRR